MQLEEKIVQIENLSIRNEEIKAAAQRKRQQLEMKLNELDQDAYENEILNPDISHVQTSNINKEEYGKLIELIKD